MQLTDNQRLFLGALLTAILVVVFQLFAAFAIPINVPPVPQSPTVAPQSFGAIQRSGILCAGSETNCVDARNGKNLIAYSDNGSTQTFKVTGSTGTLQQSGFYIMDAGTTISATTGTITPTASFQPLSAAGAVTYTLSTSGYTTGTVLTLLNTANLNILFVNTGTQKLGANCTLAQYQILRVIFDGTHWAKISCSGS